MAKQKSKSKIVQKTPTKVLKALQKAGQVVPEIAAMEDVTPILDFLENFQKLVDPSAQLPMKLISIKIPVPLLSAFRFKALQSGVPYQTMIKRLMVQWLYPTALDGSGLIPPGAAKHNLKQDDQNEIRVKR